MKKLLSLLFVLAMSLGIFACDGGGENNEKVVLTFADWGDRELNQKLINSFKDKYPHIDVTLREDFTSTGAAFTGDLISAAQAGVLPDVFVTDNVPTMVNNDLALNVASYWDKDEDAKQVYTNIANTAVYGENRFAIPSYQFLKGILINLDIFESRNLKTEEGQYRMDRNGYPVKDWTYDEFIEICKAIKVGPNYDNPTTSNTIVGLEYWYGSPDFQQVFPMQDEENVLYDTWDGTQFNYTSDGWKNAMTKKVDFYKLEDGSGANFSETYVGPEAEGYDGFQNYISAYLIGSGKAAMKIEGSWEFQQITLAAQNGINLGFWPYPGSSSGQYPPTILDYMCVSSQTRHPEEAYLFAKWMTYGKDGWNARLDEMEADKAEAINNGETPKFLDRFPIADYDGVWDRVYDLVDGIEGIEGTLDNLDKAKPDVDKWLAGYKDFWSWVYESADNEAYSWNALVAAGSESVPTFAAEWNTKVNQLVKEQMDALAAK